MRLPTIYGTDPTMILPRVPADIVMLHVERFNHAAAAHQTWAEVAAKAVRYFENEQWSEKDKALLESQGRPALTINKIKPLVKLVWGYFLNNRTDIRYMPGHDGFGTGDIAKALSHVSKAISQISKLPFVDSEVFLDGLLGGRGYFDIRLDFERNDFGEVRWRAADPFATYLDPDGDTYDINESCNYVMTSRFVSEDEVEAVYGPYVAALIKPLVDGSGWSGMPTHGLWDGWEEITPWRRFGGEQEGEFGGLGAWGNMFYEWVDRQRKSVRLLDIQHYVRVWRWFFVDLETGDRKPVPDVWIMNPEVGRAKIEKVMAWSNMQGNPVKLVRKQTRRVRWTQMIGDVVVYDDWSPYQRFTIVPFFPYFRRGKTKGMVEDLTDAQDEVNKRRSARMNIIMRSSAGGWLYEKGSLDAQQKANLELYGSTAGVQIEWDSRGGQLGKPEMIQPGTTPVAMAQLEEEAEGDLREIAGVNPDALGLVDKVQSGVAIRAKQRQTIVGLEDAIVNWQRTKMIGGEAQLEIIQDHYTEQRVVRVIGDGDDPLEMMINQQTAAGVINNVTLGKYTVSVNETPLSATFLEGALEELLRFKELGMPIPDEFVIDNSSIGRKDELKAALIAARQAQQAMETLQAGLGAPGAPPQGGQRIGGDGGNLPAEEPGAPMPQAAE